MRILRVIGQHLVFWYGTVSNYVKFYYAKKQADMRHKLTGKRYHVVPMGNKLIVVDNSFVVRYNKYAKKSGHLSIDSLSLLKMSYYSTSVESVTRK